MERFMAMVQPEPNTGCWLWAGPHDGKGYGFFKLNNRSVRAHRFSYEQVNGSIGAGLCVDHKCSVRCCVNPEHLEAVTLRENAVRTVKRGRHQHKSKTHCPRGHPYSGDNLRITAGGRQCRTCGRAATQRYNSKLLKAA
jgi:hypothetical protein